MQVEDFPGCCGAKVINNFGYTRCSEEYMNYSRLNMPSKKEVQTFVSQQIRGHKAFLVIVLNTEQSEIVGPWLTELGFRVVSKGYNAPHRSTLRMYVHTKTEK